MSYKSDAVDLIASQIDKESDSNTPKGKQLEITEEAISEVAKDVTVTMEETIDDVTGGEEVGETDGGAE